MEAKTLTSATPNYNNGVSESNYQGFGWKLQTVYQNYKTMSVAYLLIALFRPSYLFINSKTAKL